MKSLFIFFILIFSFSLRVQSQWIGANRNVNFNVFHIVTHGHFTQDSMEVKSINDLPSNNDTLLSRELSKLKLDSVDLINYSGCNTFTGKDSLIKAKCVISFKGCDHDHSIIRGFNDYFYKEYIRSGDPKIAFEKAKKFLFEKYPESPITPILNCKE